jgi:hypothetical protein
MHEPRHSGARASPASPEPKNTGKRNQWLGLRAWVPGPALTGRPGMTRGFFSSLPRIIDIFVADAAGPMKAPGWRGFLQLG